MKNVPLELNWVVKRASCSTGTMFNSLCKSIVSDVDAANAALQLSLSSQFKAKMLSDGLSIVVGQLDLLPVSTIHVGANKSHIVVKRNQEKDSEWTATVGLNDEGRCILRLQDGTELEPWQFRKKALEALFFGE